MTSYYDPRDLLRLVDIGQEACELRESFSALYSVVTTAGVHLRTQLSFDMSDVDGDPNLRVIPSDAANGDLVVAHTSYDHSAADKDINVVLAIDRFHAGR